ncbi:hypothetical protein D3C87_1696540 [compost metagenome]
MRIPSRTLVQQTAQIFAHKVRFASKHLLLQPKQLIRLFPLQLNRFADLQHTLQHLFTGKGLQ